MHPLWIVAFVFVITCSGALLFHQELLLSSLFAFVGFFALIGFGYLYQEYKDKEHK